MEAMALRREGAGPCHLVLPVGDRSDGGHGEGWQAEGSCCLLPTPSQPGPSVLEGIMY